MDIWDREYGYVNCEIMKNYWENEHFSIGKVFVLAMMLLRSAVDDSIFTEKLLEKRALFHWKSVRFGNDAS